jgi:hypothetical protein
LRGLARWAGLTVPSTLRMIRRAFVGPYRPAVPSGSVRILTCVPLSLLIEALVHFFSRPEVWRELFGHGHFLAGTRIATNARLASFDEKSPEFSQFHAFASRERFSDFSKNCGTMRSASRSYRCGLRAASRWTSSDLITDAFQRGVSMRVPRYRRLRPRCLSMRLVDHRQGAWVDLTRRILDKMLICYRPRSGIDRSNG